MAQADAQSSMRDIVIEDTEMEGYLQLQLDNRDAYDAYRAGAKQAKELLKTRLNYLINSDDDGEHSGYVICGGFRFRPRASEREAGETTIKVGEGYDFQPLEIERIGKLPGV